MDRGRPTKKIFFLVLACAIGVGSIGLAVFATRANGSISPKSETSLADKTGQDPAQTSAQTTAQTTAQMEQDGDNDGLANWEEVLWSTNPSNPDTDADGTKDGDEVRAGRNPVVAGPKDKLTTGAPAGISDTGNFGTSEKNSTRATGANSAAVNSTKPQTRIQKLSLDLFSRYMALKQGGQTLDKNVITDLIDQTLTAEDISTAKTFSANDIKTINQNSVETLTTYGNTLAGTLSKYTSTKSEYNIATAYMTTKNPNVLKQFDPILANYAAMIADIRSMTVPASAVQFHADFLNALTKTQEGIQLMRGSTDDDMLVMLMGLREFVGGTSEMRISFNNLVQFFFDNGVTFSQDSKAKIFDNKI